RSAPGRAPSDLSQHPPLTLVHRIPVSVSRFDPQKVQVAEQVDIEFAIGLWYSGIIESFLDLDVGNDWRSTSEFKQHALQKLLARVVFSKHRAEGELGVAPSLFVHV